VCYRNRFLWFMIAYGTKEWMEGGNSICLSVRSFVTLKQRGTFREKQELSGAVFLQKCMVLNPVKKFPASYESWRFISVFTRARSHWLLPWVTWVLFTPVHSCPYLSAAVYTCPKLSTFVHTCPQLSIPVHTSPYLSKLVLTCPHLIPRVHPFYLAIQHSFLTAKLKSCFSDKNPKDNTHIISRTHVLCPERQLFSLDQVTSFGE
jgi:hypothetical protein